MAKLITYDLCTPGKDYPNLIAAIKKYPNVYKVTESCWLTSSGDSCTIIRNNLWQFMDSNDKIFVATLTGETSGQNIICGQAGLNKAVFT